MQTKMMRTRRKTLKMMFIVTILVIIAYYILRSTKKQPQPKLRPKFAMQRLMSQSHTFRIVFNEKLVVEEDYNHRAPETVFQPLVEGQTLKLNRSIIGKQIPVSFAGPSEKFSITATFRPTMTESDKILFLYVFQKFVDVCKTHKISFFMKGRTLIGSYRHYGFVPWYDGIEVFVNGSQKATLARAVDKLSNFKIFSPRKSSWKFFHETLSVPTFGKLFHWPYIEIFFWANSASHFYDFTTLKKRNAHKKKNVFPLQKRPFEGALLPAPYNARRFLKKNYNILKCKTNVFSHRHQVASRWTITVPCRRLRKLYPFVRHYTKNSCKEKLYFKNQVLHRFQAIKC